MAYCLHSCNRLFYRKQLGAVLPNFRLLVCGKFSCSDIVLCNTDSVHVLNGFRHASMIVQVLASVLDHMRYLAVTND